MKNTTSLKRKILSSCISGLLVCSFVLAPVSSMFEVKKAQAAIDYDPYNTVVNAASMISNAASKVSNALMAKSLGSLTLKEYILDTIAWPLANIALEQMIRSTTQWVNSGFQGSPAFVSNLSGFMLDIADRVAGDFIWKETNLGLLCSPFKLNIKLALDIQYSQSQGGYASQCRLSSVVQNMENFLNGDFSEGGWDGWYDIALNPKSNPYSTMFEAQAALSLSISNAQGNNLSILQFGQGFLSREVCDPVCHTVTPGATIKNQLDTALDIPAKRLTVADELDELIGALFGQLVKTALGGVGGLLGLTGGGGSPTNYFDQMSATRGALNYQNSSANTIFETALAPEKTYLEQQQQIIEMITDASTYENSTYGNSCDVPGTLTSSLSRKLQNATLAASQSSIVIAALEIFNTDYKALRNVSTSQSEMDRILSKYSAATIPDAESKLMTQYTTYLNSGALHTTDETITIELQFIPALQTEIQNFMQRIDTQCRLSET